MQWDDRVRRRSSSRTCIRCNHRCGRQHGQGVGAPCVVPASDFKSDLRYGKNFGRAAVRSIVSGVELTDCGRMLLERARVIFDEVRQGVLDIEHMSDPTRGEVRIGTIGPFTGVV